MNDGPFINTRTETGDSSLRKRTQQPQMQFICSVVSSYVGHKRFCGVSNGR